MNAVVKPHSLRNGQGQRSWTDAQRAEQARKFQTRQIWLKSTGPRTEQGKINSSKNARHAGYEQRQAEINEIRHVRAYLRTQKSYIDLLKLFLKQKDSLDVVRHNVFIDQLFFLQNELIDLKRKMFDAMRFCEMIRLDNHNIIPFRGGQPPNNS